MFIPNAVTFSELSRRRKITFSVFLLVVGWIMGSSSRWRILDLWHRSFSGCATPFALRFRCTPAPPSSSLLTKGGLGEIAIGSLWSLFPAAVRPFFHELVEGWKGGRERGSQCC